MDALMYKLGCTLIWILLYFGRASSLKKDVWQPVTVSAALMRNTTNTRKTFNALSDIVCAMNASRFFWGNLFCFNNELCEVSSYKAVPYPSATIISDPLDCMTKLDGCLYNSVLYSKLDNLTVPYGPACLTCDLEHGIMGPYPYTVNSTGKCNPPYQTYSPYGCFLLGPPASFCDARKYCQAQGGDLWVFDGNMTLAYLDAAANALGITGNKFWAGAYGNGTGVNWITGAAHEDAPGSSYPINLFGPHVDGYCVRYTPTYLTLCFSLCTTTSYLALCQKNVAA